MTLQCYPMSKQQAFSKLLFYNITRVSKHDLLPQKQICMDTCMHPFVRNHYIPFQKEQLFMTMCYMWSKFDVLNVNMSYL